MMSWDEGIEGAARDIAATDHSPLRVMAGPGTGKSFAIKRRVARLLEQGANARRILAVTFTRNAAQGLVTELHALGVADCQNVKAGTLHSLCFSLLTRREVLSRLNRTPRTIVAFEKSGSLQFEGSAMLADLVDGDFGDKRARTKRVTAFQAAWARLQTEQPGWALDPIDQRFHAQLLEWLRFHNAMLVGELVPEALKYLRHNPSSTERNAYDHVIVDEYQDLNKAEQTLIDLIAENSRLVIVGDADQSIYSFRHAHPDGIITFPESHPATKDVALEECRRCPVRVVEMANQLIRVNHPNQSEHTLRSRAVNKSGHVHVVQWSTIDSEAEGIASYVRALLAREVQVEGDPLRPGDVLILAPNRILGYGIRDRISKLGMPVHSYFNEELLEGGSAQRALALLTLLTNEEDRVALRWWLGAESDTFLRDQYRRLRDYCVQSGHSPKSALEEVSNGRVKLGRISQLMRKYEDLKRQLEELTTLGVAEVIDRLLPDGDDDCGALREIALSGINHNEDLPLLFDRLRAQVTQPEMPEEGYYVRVMSLHKSKGLTSRVVVVCGCVEGLIPTRREADDPLLQMSALQEQRRLFYVAITRSSQVLVLSSAASMERLLGHKMGVTLRDGARDIASTIASQFLDEFGQVAPPSKRGDTWARNGYR